MVLVAALRKKQSVSLHLCRLGFNLLNCSKHSATALDYACTSPFIDRQHKMPMCRPLRNATRWNRAMQHGDLLTDDQSSFFGFYCHSATIF
jgi:hypothetical protein